MASGKPIGTMFVELDLDTTRYTKAQQAMLRDATKASDILEKNFQNLGIKSAAHYDLLRSKVQLSYEAIVNSSKVSANDILRAEEAKNAKLKALNEQQFGAHVGLVERIKKNWVAAGVAAAGAIALIQQAIGYMDEAAKALQVESSFKIMADSAGVNSERLIASMKKATRETIDDSAMMQKAVKLMTLGYDPSQIERFSKVVITASQIAGTTAAEAYDNLADAIGNRTPKAMIRMGAATREQMKVLNEAVAAGASETALFELAMANLELKQKILQGTMDDSAIFMQRFHAQTKELAETVGKVLIVALGHAASGFMLLSAGVAGLISAYARYRAFVYEVMGDERQRLENLQTANQAEQLRMDYLEKAGALIGANAEKEQRASADEIASARAKVDAQMKALKAIADAEKGRKDMLKSLQHEAKSLYDTEVQAAEHAARMAQDAGQNELKTIEQTYGARQAALNEWYDAEYAALMKWSKTSQVAQQAVKALYEDYSKKWAENEQKKVEATAAYNTKSIETEARMYREINEFSTEAVNAEIKALERRAREEGRWTAESWLKYAALAEGRMKIEDRVAAKALAGWAVINEYSDRAIALRKYQYEREAVLIEAATKGEIKANEYVTEKVREETNKRAATAANYYATIPGYSDAALEHYLRNLDREREKVAQVTGDEAASYRWLAERQRDYTIAMLRQSESYLDQTKAAWMQFSKESEDSQGKIYDVTKKAFDGMADAMADFVQTGKMDFRSLADSIIRDLLRIAMQKAMVGIFGGGFGFMSGFFGGGGAGYMSAGAQAEIAAAGGMSRGGVLSRGRVVPYASGGVVDRPTFFPMANGAGLMGEAGPEAIMPLKRLPGGRLGVEAQPAGNLTISVPVTVAQKNNRMASELRTEIEDTVQRVIRRYS